MLRDRTNQPGQEDAPLVAIRALGWLLGEQARAERFLALTGLDVAELRARIDDPALLAAAVDFLAAHEPDLLSCADELGLAPGRLVAAGQALR
jgi:hypothetical protein